MANFFKVRNNERVMLFIDGPNFYNCAKSLDVSIDYKRLLAQFDAPGYLVRANYYMAVTDNENPVRQLLDWIDYNGYALHTKPAKEFETNDGRRIVKGNMDVIIAVDVMEQLPNYDHAILFAGNGDFKHLVSAVQRAGKRVSVVSTINMVSDDLRRQVDKFIDMDDDELLDALEQIR